MISLSRRYAVAVLLLCLVAAVPVYLHSSGALARDDCAHPEAIEGALSIPGTQLAPPRRRMPSGTFQLSRGTLAWGEEPEYLRFVIQRTYQPVRLLNPPQRVAQAFQVETQETKLVRHGDTEFPIHWAIDGTQPAVQFAAYIYVYQARPQQDPMRALFGSSLTRITGGARPFTLFVVGGSVRRGKLPQARQAAEDWLVAAWRHYDAVCNAEHLAAE